MRINKLILMNVLLQMNKSLHSSTIWCCVFDYARLLLAQASECIHNAWYWPQSTSPVDLQRFITLLFYSFSCVCFFSFIQQSSINSWFEIYSGYFSQGISMMLSDSKLTYTWFVPRFEIAEKKSTIFIYEEFNSITFDMMC